MKIISHRRVLRETWKFKTIVYVKKKKTLKCVKNYLPHEAAAGDVETGAVRLCESVETVTITITSIYSINLVGVIEFDRLSVGVKAPGYTISEKQASVSIFLSAGNNLKLPALSAYDVHMCVSVCVWEVAVITPTFFPPFLPSPCEVNFREMQQHSITSSELRYTQRHSWSAL